jgi:peptide chain release factor 1
MDFSPHIARIRARFAELEADLARPGLFNDPQRAQQVTREHSRLRGVLEIATAYEQTTRQLAEARELSEAGDADMAALAIEEIPDLETKLATATQTLRFAIIPPDPEDSRNTIVEIRAGTGGDEAALFAADLCRMYTRYAEREGWKTEVMEVSQGEKGGLREIIFQVNGEDVYRKMRYESGVHRVQRVPVTEAQGRIHTSTSTVAVLPEAQEVDLVLKPEDLKIEVCRAGGPGGQGVNTTDSAVRVVHLPTGLEVRCQDGRSQIKNKDKAINILRARLLEQKRAEEEAKYAAHRRSQIGRGDRNEKIRTYNFPQNRVTDHRINFTTHNLSGVLDGAIDELLDHLMAAALEEKFAELEKGELR